MIELTTTDATNDPVGQRVGELVRFLHTIQPGKDSGRKCAEPGCWGSRGYTVHEIIQTDGTKRVSVRLCCGRVGKSDFGLIDDRLSRLEESIKVLGADIMGELIVTRNVVRYEGLSRLVKWHRTFRRWRNEKRNLTPASPEPG